MKHTVEEIRLKNGARGLLIDVPDATVMSFQVQFRAGNRIWQNCIKCHILLRQTLFQLISLRPKLLVGHLFIFVIQTVNNVNLLTQSFQNLLLWIAS
jgi:hypothetical protein